MNVDLIKVASSRSMPTPLLLRMVIALTLTALTSYPAKAAIDAGTVQQTIDRGVAYLKSTQGNQGGWKEYLGPKTVVLARFVRLPCSPQGFPPTILRFKNRSTTA